MFKSATAAKSLFAVIALAASFGAANAETIRDHRTICVIGDADCRDHRGPAVVVPPRHLPPVVVVDTPVMPIDPGIGDGTWGHDDDDDDYLISCREGRRLVRENGFRHVRAFDCEGSVFGYRASSRHGGAIVKVSNRGQIISVQRYIY